MNKTVLSKHSIEFLAVANEFVKYCESTDDIKIIDFIDTASKLLSLLYLKVLFLDNAHKIDIEESDYDFEFVSALRYEAVKTHAETILGDADIYVPLKDASLMNSQDYINISLSELWADIYQDIANFVEAYRIGENILMQEATYRCIENFRSYWGVRLLNLLEHFHRLRFIDKID